MPPVASSPPAGRSLQIELFTPSWIQYLAHLYQPDTDAKAAPRAPTAAPHWLICVSLEWVKTSWQTCIYQADISSLTLSGNVRKCTCLCNAMPLQRSTAPCLYFLFFFLRPTQDGSSRGKSSIPDGCLSLNIWSLPSATGSPSPSGWLAAYQHCCRRLALVASTPESIRLIPDSDCS